jgi:hypothetical protein
METQMVKILAKYWLIPILAIAFQAFAQVKDRNIDEIKQESLHRAENGGAYPLLNLKSQM